MDRAASRRIGMIRCPGKGMEAMASSRPFSAIPFSELTPRPQRRLSQLWQLPLLLLSIGLFGYAAYLFIDPKPGLSVEQKLNIARDYLTQERPDAAIEYLNKLAGTDAAAAAASLEECVARKDITDSERSWALCEIAHLRIDRSNFNDARELLAAATKLTPDSVDQGQINFWLGYCAWKLGDPD